LARPLGDIVHALGGQLHGDAALVVERLAPIATAAPSDMAFVAHARYASQIETTRAGVLIVTPALAPAARRRGACVIDEDPYLYFARLTQWWRQEHSPKRPARIDPTAHIHPDAVVEEGVDIGPFAVVDEGARIGSGSRIGAHSVIEPWAQIGSGTRVGARVVIGDRCQVGARCILHAGVVIGADGFGFAPHDGRWVKIEQLGAVRIGDDVEIGANTCIDRGALDDTVIGDGVKLDNLVQVGHNVQIGAHSAVAGCAGIAGSATIGAHCTVGGGAGILGHLTLADGVHVSSFSLVTRSLQQPGLYTGVFPIDENGAWEKNAASLKQLNRLRERLKKLEQAMEPAPHTKEQP
jgi:UDP-3-O-[3-hydroxymyristoyl] glucosamine N-acyltransferase